jgi:hypothetical protein
MKRKLWFALISIVSVMTFWCSSALAVTVTFDGYTAWGSSSISQSSQFAAVRGSGSTSYELTYNCAVIVKTTMHYFMVVNNGQTVSYYPDTMTASASHDGGGPVTATCSTPTGNILVWYEPNVETSTHTVIHNGVNHIFQSSSD